MLDQARPMLQAIQSKSSTLGIVARDRHNLDVVSPSMRSRRRSPGCAGLALPDTSECLSHGGPAFFIRSKKCLAMFLNDHHNDGRLTIWRPAPEGFRPRWSRPIQGASSGRPMSVTLVARCSAAGSGRYELKRDVGRRSWRHRVSKMLPEPSSGTSGVSHLWRMAASGFVAAGSIIAMTIGALGYLVAFGDMNLRSTRIAVEVARLLSAFTGLGGHVGSPSARRVSRLLGPFSRPLLPRCSDDKPCC